MVMDPGNSGGFGSQPGGPDFPPDFLKHLHRKFKKPIHVCGFQAQLGQIADVKTGQPKVKFVPTRIEVNNIKDLATLQKWIEGGKLIPYPSLAIQVIQLVAEWTGVLETPEEAHERESTEKPKPISDSEKSGPREF